MPERIPHALFIQDTQLGALGAATVKALGFVIAACMILAVLRYAAAALLIALSGLMLWGALRYSREFIGFIAISVALGMMEHQPYIALGLMALSAVVTAGDGKGA